VADRGRPAFISGPSKARYRKIHERSIRGGLLDWVS